MKIKNAKLNILSLFIVLIAFFPYTTSNQISIIVYSLLMDIFIIILLNSSIKIEKNYFFILIVFFCLLFIIVIEGLIRTDFNYINSYSDLLKRIIVIISIVLVVSNSKYEINLNLWHKIIKCFFLIGIIFLIFQLIGYRFINENTISFFILPYLGLKIIKYKSRLIKFLWYLIGLFILFFSNGRSALLAFLLTPIWLVIIKSRFIFRLTFLSMVAISIILPFYFPDFLMQLDDKLSGRGYLWVSYAEASKEYLLTLFFGTGDYTLQEENLLGAHNTWLGTVWTIGLIGLLMNALVIVYYLKIDSGEKKQYPISLVIIYIFTVQIFESVNIGGISFMSLILLWSLLILRKSNKIA